VKGFENAAPLGLPKHSPACFLSVYIRVIRGSKFIAPVKSIERLEAGYPLTKKGLKISKNELE